MGCQLLSLSCCISSGARADCISGSTNVYADFHKVTANPRAAFTLTCK